MESAPKAPARSSKSSESSPRTSLSDRLNGLVSTSRPGTPPSASRSHNYPESSSGLRRAVLDPPTNELEKLPPARVTTPHPDSPFSDDVPNTAATRSKLDPEEAGRATGRVQTLYAPAALESLQDALSDDSALSRPKRSPSTSSTHSSMPPSFLSSRTPRLLDALTRSTMPTASLSVPPKAYLHTPIPSPFRDTQRATAQAEAVLNPPVAASQPHPVSRRAESPAQSPTLLAPSRSSIDSLRGTLKRSESMHTTASQNKGLASWWFGENKQDVDHLLDESDRAETAEQEQDGFRNKYLTPRNPIVFCHGLFGFDTLTLGPSFAPVSISHWRGISEVLAAAGADVLVTRVPATSAVPSRAAVLREKIAETYPGRSVHLIGHSMGGLDCRYLACQLMKERNGEIEVDEDRGKDVQEDTSVQRGGEYRREGGPERAEPEGSKKAEAEERKRKKLAPFKVLSVTTIATPHRGSAFADYFLSTLGRQNLPNFVALMDKLPIGGGDGKAFESLTLESMRKFNAQTPDDPNVHYFSWGSKFEPGILDALGFGQVQYRPFSHKIILQKEGPNDGLVSVKSARWGTYLGTLDGVNHLELVGWVNQARNTITEWMGGETNFRPATFYLGIANTLAEVVEGQERKSQAELDPGATLVKEPESIQGMPPEMSLPKKTTGKENKEGEQRKISVDSRGRTIEE
ncbi:alpha/beta hydrolase family protein [Ceratobasidium sp. AG-Ba]|nr:alpha/beta hydrolase family protein [Ceratobasidium sp. AG-Ba]